MATTVIFIGIWYVVGADVYLGDEHIEKAENMWLKI